MRERQKNLLIHAALATAGVVSSALCYKIGKLSEAQRLTEGMPQMVSFDDSQITYSDNIASGMRAYAVRPNSRGLLELQENKIDNNSITFSIPPSLGIDDKFGIITIDRDANVSQPAYFSIEGDKITERQNE